MIMQDMFTEKNISVIAHYSHTCISQLLQAQLMTYHEIADNGIYGPISVVMLSGYTINVYKCTFVNI